MEQVNPIELLKEEMENDEIYIRVNAIHRLKTIAVLMGTEGIKSQILPYLDFLIKREDDEVLFAIAEEFGNLGPLYPSPLLPQQQSILVQYLEVLAGVEETVVRESAVRSLNSICASLSDYEILNTYIPMIIKLANNEANFTCRVSAVNLMYSIYPRAGSQKEKIRQKFSELCNEETPMVRRAVATRIGDFAKSLEKEFVLGEIIPLFKQLSGDDQDQVRVLCLDSLKQLARILQKDEIKVHLIPIIIAATEDKSWRVRLALSKNFAELTEAFGKETTDVSLIQIFTNLLRDTENDVKIAAISSLSQFIKQISPDKMSILIGPIQNLAKDGNAHVRAVITDVFAVMIPLIGKDSTQQKLLPSITELFSDENTDVRIGVAKAAAKFIQVSGPDSFGTLGAHLKNAIQDNKWRVRVAVMEGIIDLALFFQSNEMMTKYIEPIFYFYLKDRTYSVREMALGKLKALVQTYKMEWVNSSLLPKLADASSKENGYLIRITALYSLQTISPLVSSEYNKEKILPILLKNAKDNIANIRFVVAKIFKALATTSMVNFSAQIKQCLIEMGSDSDKDVQYYSQDAIKSISAN